MYVCPLLSLLCNHCMHKVTSVCVCVCACITIVSLLCFCVMVSVARSHINWTFSFLNC